MTLLSNYVLNRFAFDRLANSEDRAHLQLDAPGSNVTFPPPTDALPYPEATSIGIGEQFYALSANLPNGTPM